MASNDDIMHAIERPEAGLDAHESRAVIRQRLDLQG
jgi:hypothetical protein